MKHILCRNCPNTEFFWSVFSRIHYKYGKIRTRKNSIFGHFSRSDTVDTYCKPISNLKSKTYSSVIKILTLTLTLFHHLFINVL